MVVCWRWCAIVVRMMLMLVAAEVIVMMVMRAVHFARRLLEEIAHFLNDIRIGCYVKIDQWLDHILAVIRFAHLQRDQWINIDQTQIEAIGAQRAKVGILCGVIVVQNIGWIAAWIASRGVGQTEANPICGQNLALYQLNGLEGGQCQRGLSQCAKTLLEEGHTVLALGADGRGRATGFRTRAWLG